MVLSRACLKGRQSHCSQPWNTLVFSHLHTSSYSFSYESIWGHSRWLSVGARAVTSGRGLTSQTLPARDGHSARRTGWGWGRGPRYRLCFLLILTSQVLGPGSRTGQKLPGASTVTP